MRFSHRAEKADCLQDVECSKGTRRLPPGALPGYAREKGRAGERDGEGAINIGAGGRAERVTLRVGRGPALRLECARKRPLPAHRPNVGRGLMAVAA